MIHTLQKVMNALQNEGYSVCVEHDVIHVSIEEFNLYRITTLKERVIIQSIYTNRILDLTIEEFIQFLEN